MKLIEFYHEWDRVLIMMGMIFGGIVIGITAIEPTDDNTILFGFLALLFIIPSSILQIKFFKHKEATQHV